MLQPELDYKIINWSVDKGTLSTKNTVSGQSITYKAPDYETIDTVIAIFSGSEGYQEYENNGEFIHSFTPFPPTKIEEVPHKRPHMLWNDRLKWTLPETRDLSETLIHKISFAFPGIVHKPRFKWYCFYISESTKRKNEFYVMLLGKYVINLCIRIQRNLDDLLMDFSFLKKLKGVLESIKTTLIMLLI